MVNRTRCYGKSDRRTATTADPARSTSATRAEPQWFARVAALRPDTAHVDITQSGMESTGAYVPSTVAAG